MNSGSPENQRRFDLLLEFKGGHLTGVGNDENGMFVLSGDFEAMENECRWIQTYLFGETLFYRGFLENNRIWGTWQNANEFHGGFHIWPAKTAPVTERHINPFGG